MDNKKYNRLILSTIFSFVLIFVSLVSIKSAPTGEYEISIYSATPIIFWIAMFYGVFNGICLLIYNIYTPSKRVWIVGLFEILFCQSLMLLLYNLRGYFYLERGDTLTYIGMIKDISVYGHVLDYNFYPIISIWGSQISQITNVPILTISSYLPTLWFVCYILYICVWAKALINTKKFMLCTIISSTPFFFAYFSTTIYHMLLAVYTLPLLFYLFQKKNDYRFRILVIILLLTYPFLHPIISVIVLLYIFGFMISEVYINRTYHQTYIYSLLIGAISLLTWFFYQKVLFKEFSYIILQLLTIYNTETSFIVAKNYMDNLLTINQIIHILVPVYDDIIYYILFFLFVHIITSRNVSNQKDNLFGVMFNFIFGNLALIIMFLFLRVHNPIRLMNMNQNVILLVPLVGYILYYFSNDKKKLKFMFIICLIIFSQFVSMLSIYQSPISMLPNDQITKNEVLGMEWLIVEKNINFRTLDILSPVYRYSDLIYGHKYTSERNDLYRDSYFLKHYEKSNDSNKELLLSVDDNRYLIVTEYDVQAYTNIWKETNLLSKKDFDNIDSFKNVDRIYSSNLFTINFVRKIDL